MITKIHLLEIPLYLSVSDRQYFINLYLNDLQRNGIAILSTNYDSSTSTSAIYKVEYLKGD